MKYFAYISAFLCILALAAGDSLRRVQRSPVPIADPGPDPHWGWRGYGGGGYGGYGGGGYGGYGGGGYGGYGGGGYGRGGYGGGGYGGGGWGHRHHGWW